MKQFLTLKDLPNLDDAVIDSIELKKNPLDIAKNIAESIPKINDIKIDIVKPGYINFIINDY